MRTWFSRDNSSDWWFRCKVSNEYGSVYSNSVSFNLTSGWNAAPFYSSDHFYNPDIARVEIGKSAELRRQFYFSNDFVWQVSTNGGSSWSAVSGSNYSASVREVTYYADKDRADIAVLTINSVTPDIMSYRYRVLAGNNAGEAYSDVITLEIREIAPVITSHPTNTSAPNGGSATFSVAATGADSYRWQYSNNGGSSWSNVTGGAYHNTTTPTLTIDPVMAGTNGYQYRCAVTNAKGTTNSKAAKLTVQ